MIVFPYALPCKTPGCENVRRPEEDVCGACAIKIANAMRREEARWTIYAYAGIRQLERYLEGWAAFDQWLIRHPPV